MSGQQTGCRDGIKPGERKYSPQPAALRIVDICLRHTSNAAARELTPYVSAGGTNCSSPKPGEASFALEFLTRRFRALDNAATRFSGQSDSSDEQGKPNRCDPKRRKHADTQIVTVLR